MSATPNLFDRFRHQVRRTAPAAFAVLAMGNLAACGSDRSLGDQVREMHQNLPGTLALSPADLEEVSRSVYLGEEMEGREAGSSAQAPYSAVLDLTRNVLTWYDREGNITDAPTDMGVVEQAIAARRIIYTGSLDARYEGLSPAETQRRMREPTQVMNCSYENACLSQVSLIRGAPGDPRGFTTESMSKREGGEARFLEAAESAREVVREGRAQPASESVARRQAAPRPRGDLDAPAPTTSADAARHSDFSPLSEEDRARRQRDEETMRAMAQARQGGRLAETVHQESSRAPAGILRSSDERRARAEQKDEESLSERIRREQTENLEEEIRRTANNTTYNAMYRIRRGIEDKVDEVVERVIRR